MAFRRLILIYSNGKELIQSVTSFQVGVSYHGSVGQHGVPVVIDSVVLVSG